MRSSDPRSAADILGILVAVLAKRSKLYLLGLGLISACRLLSFLQFFAAAACVFVPFAGVCCWCFCSIWLISRGARLLARAPVGPALLLL